MKQPKRDLLAVSFLLESDMHNPNTIWVKKIQRNSRFLLSNLYDQFI
jgi:hypothetical protein